MLTHILTAALLVTFIACDSKEYKKEENDQIDIVSELNQGNSQAVIEKLSAQESLTPRQTYYLASAQSQEAGVDVFSLYPILEIQLFHKNALDWSDLSKDKNPMMKFMKKQDNVDVERRQKIREERWEKYLPQISQDRNINYNKPTLEDIKKRYNSNQTQEEYNEADQHFEKIHTELFELKIVEDYLMYDELYKRLDSENNFGGRYYDLMDYHTDMLVIKYKKDRYLHPENYAGDAVQTAGWEMIYMNVLWNTYEAIPMIKKMPSLSEEKQDRLTEALDNYYSLVKDPEFKPVALKNIALLSVVSILSYYKESMDLEEVNDMKDLVCGFDPEPMVKNYPMIRKRLMLLIKLSEEMGVEFPEIDNVKQSMKDIEKLMPEELTPEARDKYVQGMDKFKVSSCFN